MGELTDARARLNKKRICRVCRTRDTWLDMDVCFICHENIIHANEEKRHFAGGKLFSADDGSTWGKTEGVFQGGSYGQKVKENLFRRKNRNCQCKL